MSDDQQYLKRVHEKIQQGKYNGPKEPRDEDIVVSGPDHKRTFCVACEWCKREFSAKTKRAALSAWAEDALHHNAACTTDPKRDTVTTPTRQGAGSQTVAQITCGEDPQNEPLKALHEYFAKRGLAQPIMDDKMCGHPPLWYAWFRNTPDKTFCATTRNAAKGLCATDFLQSKETIAAVSEQKWPLLNVTVDMLRTNPPKSEERFWGVQALDMEWDPSNDLFVCAALARSETEVLLFTDYERLLHYMDQSAQLIVFAAENDTKLFPHVFRTNAQLVITDVRDMLPKHSFSKNIGLNTLLGLKLHLSLDKSLQTSFVHGQRLSPDQCLYVARDALAALLLYEAFL